MTLKSYFLVVQEKVDLYICKEHIYESNKPDTRSIFDLLQQSCNVKYLTLNTELFQVLAMKQTSSDPFLIPSTCSKESLTKETRAAGVVQWNNARCLGYNEKVIMKRLRPVSKNSRLLEINWWNQEWMSVATMLKFYIFKVEERIKALQQNVKHGLESHFDLPNLPLMWAILFMGNLSSTLTRTTGTRYTWQSYSERLLTLAGVYGFWKRVSKFDRLEIRRYHEMFYALKFLLFKPNVSRQRCPASEDRKGNIGKCRPPITLEHASFGRTDKPKTEPICGYSYYLSKFLHEASSISVREQNIMHLEEDQVAPSLIEQSFYQIYISLIHIHLTIFDIANIWKLLGYQSQMENKSVKHGNLATQHLHQLLVCNTPQGCTSM
ncbi:sucrose synthase [Artemisia annua]|uniref:sucrose synthase n=1 Tax=Artemisia annua TaxID=35608 RepID=A0A2U1KUM5_ARTAN|nr:sucrose synthase [Artemisia annua]